MAFRHGVFSAESATSLLTPANASYITVAFGTAPTHLAQNPAPPNKPILCYQLREYVDQFGYNDNFSDFTLNEVANSQFVLYKMAPVVFVNVLDPDKHYTQKTENFAGVSSISAIIDGNVIPDTVEITSSDTEVVQLTGNIDYTETLDTDTQITTIDIMIGATLPANDINISYDIATDSFVTDCAVSNLPFDLPTGATNINITAEKPVTNTLTANIDYTAAYNSDNEFIVTILDDTKIFNDTVQISWHELDPSQVTESDIIGGVDNFGNTKGLEVLEEIFPRYRIVPSTIIAPKFSQSPTVAACLKAKCTNINGVFKAIALADLPSDEIINYTNAPEYKNNNNLIDTSLVVCYPKISLGGQQYFLSTQLAALMNKTDYDHGDIPYKSPSNESLQCDSSVLADGTEKFFSLEQANYLNSQGIVTALNFSGGWRAWGNFTSEFPSNTDVKDYFLPIRRMFNWIANELILTFWSKIDDPLNKRLIQSVIDSAQIWLNGLTARGALLGGRVELLDTDNTTTDLMAGIINFRLYITPPSPAQEIVFIQEYDPSYISELFS